MRFKLRNISYSSKEQRNCINNMLPPLRFRRNFEATWKRRKCLMALTSGILLLILFIENCECQHLPSISQISPKSRNKIDDNIHVHTLRTSSHLKLESTIANPISNIVRPPSNSKYEDDNETRSHLRVERSASPILNENLSKSGTNEVYFSEDKEKKEAGAGRYFQYDIKPTGTYDTKAENLERTQRGPAVDKTISKTTTKALSASDSFLLKGDTRHFTSGSLINPTKSTATSVVSIATAITNNGRQNSNPDIQDIITGIVKLLNGNVNVHANTQGLRRPAASRINNRGPPRISDVQTLPVDYEKPALGSSIRPPPYPFDRPERPFITGVPIPEQIVPYRPGFVSNRPPWHRNKPRPPITTSIGSRRPISQYKPVQQPEIQNEQENDESEIGKQEKRPPSIEQEVVEQQHVENTSTTGSDYNEALETPKPTDTSYDSEFSNEDGNSQYIEVSDRENDSPVSDTDSIDVDEDPKLPSTLEKKEEHNKKKSGAHKILNEKKKPEYTTIIETSSEVHTVMHMSSTYIPIPMDTGDSDPDLNPSMEEVIFMTASKTPALEKTISTSSSTIFSSIITDDVQSTETSENIIKSTPVVDETTDDINNSKKNSEFKTTIVPTRSTLTSSPYSTFTTTTSSTISSIEKSSTNSDNTQTTTSTEYHPRPGIVLDDPEFKPGGRLRPKRPQQTRPSPPIQIQSTRPHLPLGYGEIFDVTLSAIQGPGTIGNSQQTINIKPFGTYGSGGHGGHGGQLQGDIIVSASGDDGFVSIDGKRTYINLFGDPTDPPINAQLPVTPATAVQQLHSSTTVGSIGQNTHLNNGYAVPETEVVSLKAQTAKPIRQTSITHTESTRPHYRPRTTQAPVRIDTCIVGDDSTCDQAQHERCKTENGVSSCHCRPGYSRRKLREPCRKIISFFLSIRVDRIYDNNRIEWNSHFLDPNSDFFKQLSYESVRAIDSAMSMTPYSDEFMNAKVNNIYRDDPHSGTSGVFINMTIKLDENVESLRPNLRIDVQKHLLGVLQRRNNNIGNSVLYVSTPEGAVSSLHDLDECKSHNLNDCHANAICLNTWGSFRCTCESGFRDPWADQLQRSGRDCQTCPESFCNNRGTCSFNEEGSQICTCDSNHYGSQCEVDGEVLAVAIGASISAVVIIVLTLVCLIMWSRRWQSEQKNAMGSPVFGYMNTAPLKSAGLPQPGYQVTLEDRMRWAQIADVMAQTNHYGAEPINPTRPSSALFAYPNLQTMGMGTIGGMSIQSTMQIHPNSSNMAAPVPMPRRIGLTTRSNGMRTLENSSSSEEEDRADLLGRNFQVPRPKSRSNGSIANQSGIYYDVDYEPSGNGIGNTSVDHLYGSQNQSSSHSQFGSSSHLTQGIPMSTYTSGRPTNSYYMK